MKIKEIRIRNYKSWNDSNLITLADGLNVIVGQNNAGKTAFLEALSLNRGGVPHKTLKSKPEFDSYIDNNAFIDITFQFGPNELFRAALGLHHDFFIPLPEDKQPVGTALTHVIQRLQEPNKIVAEFTNAEISRADFDPSWYSPARKYIRCRVNRGMGSIELVDSTVHPENSVGTNRLSWMLIETLRKRIYFLRAERYNISSARVEHPNELLEQNCNNLAQVLHVLQSGNPERYKRVIELLKKVFPRIKAVTVPVTGGHAQIVIWSIDPKTERKDLAVPLADSGTGIGQVLAMLYLIIHSDVPQCILIDEPQSFLHPGATRSLLEILHANPRHQYIVTTHSPFILSIPSSKVIHIVHDGNQSKADVIDGPKAQEARLMLQDLGFKLSDVFGADKIIWVEGPTEEECFKLIVRSSKDDAFWGIEIIGVRSTGDLEGRNAEASYDIYTNLSKKIGIIPPAVGFIFDKEMRSDAVIQDLKRKSRSRVFFLSRRMYENYLLDPSAIAAALNTESQSERYDSSVILTWIKTNGSNKKYLRNVAARPLDESWFINVNGAEILRDIFKDITENTITYDKVKHGYLLTKILLEGNPSAFSEVKDLLHKVVGSQDIQ